MMKIASYLLTAVSISFLCGCYSLDTGNRIQTVAGNAGTSVESSRPTNSLHSVTTLAEEFQKLHSGHERVIFVLRLVDDGTISVGTPIDSIKQIFDKRYSDRGVIRNGEGKGFLYLADAPRHDEVNPLTVLPKGWCMAIYYKEDGRISAYYMTNLWKVRDIETRWREDTKP